MGAMARTRPGRRVRRTRRTVSLRSLRLISPWSPAPDRWMRGHARRSLPPAPGRSGLARLSPRSRFGRHRCSRSPSSPSIRSPRGGSSSGSDPGWFEPEHLAYGFPFADTPARFDEFERQLAEIVRPVDGCRRRLAEARAATAPADHRRRQSDAADRSRRDPFRRRVQHSRSDARRGTPTLQGCARGAAEAGREPLTFSIMIGCAVGRDESRGKGPTSRVAGHDRPRPQATARRHGRAGDRSVEPI